MTPHPKSTLYTKTGDQGKTRLVDGSCVEKFNPAVEAYGCVDELNSQLGLIIHLAGAHPGLSPKNIADLVQTQHLLFNLGSLLACTNHSILTKLPSLTSDHVLWIEQAIDEADAQTEKISEFILPGGCLLSSHLHIARTICRRTERRTAEMESTLPEHQTCLIFLNRLSDYLFALGRLANKTAGTNDITWEKR